MPLTTVQDRLMAALRATGFIPFSGIRSALELNALRDLTIRGLARFAWFGATCGYILVGHPTLKEVA
jgi:hypothetical protein